MPNAIARDPGLHWSSVLRSHLQQVNEVDWRLGQSSIPVCPTIVSGHGLLFDSLLLYEESDREDVSQAIELGSNLQVAAIAEGSPGFAAGLQLGDSLVAIDGKPVFEFVGMDAGLPNSEVIEEMLARLEAGQTFELAVERNGEVIGLEFTPHPRCNVGIVLKVDKSVEAYSDFRNVAITTGLARFIENDAELALIAGHELAHVVLQARHAENRISGKKKEDEADALGAQLAHCAGYDVRKASEFWLRFGEMREFPLHLSLSHRSGARRFDRLNQLINSLDCEIVGSVLEAPN